MPWEELGKTQVKIDPSQNAVQLTGRKAQYTYEEIKYRVIAAKKCKLLARGLGSDNAKLYIKEPGGSWTLKYTLPSSIIRAGIITDNGTTLVFAGDGKVYRSTDDTNFTVVLEAIRPPFGSNSIGNNGNTVCFSTYGTATDDAIIYTSIDDGENWAATLTLTAGTVTHFHTCQWLRPRKKWVATTGDGLMRWYESYDGITWNLIASTTDQRFRTLGLSAISSTELMWSSDGSIGNEGVYYVDFAGYASAINEHTIKRLVKLPNVSYGLTGWLNIAMVCTRCTDSYIKNRYAYLYSTIDGGNEWQIEKSYLIDPNTTDGGFWEIIGPDTDGKIYAILDGAYGITSGTTIVATPNFEVDRKAISEFDVYESAPKVELLISVINNNSLITNSTLRIGSTAANDTNLVNLYVGKHRRRCVVIYNNHDQAITLAAVHGKTTSHISSPSVNVVSNVNIPAAGTVVIEEVDYPKINTPMPWLYIALKQGETAPTSGTVHVYVYGVQGD